MISLFPYIIAVIVISISLILLPYFLSSRVFDKVIVTGLLIVSIFSFNFIGDAIVKQSFWLLTTIYILYIYIFKYKCFSVVKKTISLPLILLFCYCSISIFYSPIFFVSFKRLFLLFAVLLLASYIAIRKNTEDGKSVFNDVYSDFFYPTFFFVFLGGVYSVLFPSNGFGPDGSMNGFADHKNIWGFFSFFLSFFSFCFFINGKNVKISLLAYVVGFLSVIFSRSTTSLVCVCILTLFLIVITLRVNYKQITNVITLATLAIAACLILSSFIINGDFSVDYMSDLFFTSVGKSETLTGRVKLWALMQNEISYHRFIGVGYGGFWNEMDGPSRLVISQLYWGPPSQAHNGYIDIINEIGLIGFSFLIMLFIQHLMNLIKIWLVGELTAVAPHFVFFISVLFYNYTESSILRNTNIMWVLLLISIMYVEFIKNKIRLDSLSKV